MWPYYLGWFRWLFSIDLISKFDEVSDIEATCLLVTLNAFSSHLKVFGTIIFLLKLINKEALVGRLNSSLLNHIILLVMLLYRVYLFSLAVEIGVGGPNIVHGCISLFSFSFEILQFSNERIANVWNAISFYLVLILELYFLSLFKVF